MARRPVLPPSRRRAVVAKKSEVPTLSLERTVEELKLQARALDMSVDGASHREIADELGVSMVRIPKLLAEGLGELIEKRDVAAEKFFALHRRRYDKLIRVWNRKATGYTEEIENEDGALVEVTHPPDPKAMQLMLKLQADYAKMFGFNKLRVEHTGAHGGPILNLNANIDWSRASDEQLAQAAAGNAEVIRQLSGASAGSSAAGDASEDQGEGRPSTRRH